MFSNCVKYTLKIKKLFYNKKSQNIKNKTPQL